ncbi:toll-like receptor 7 [Sitodiplosis mosellana]|uniref:toll-like receptor 7 n=1 Tax=Sitodiplosis mosellana TaxID=263140 RepID=UPI002444C53A|nr:toll-like receptor 7 [Sitodiplosis mosellana]
MELFYFLAIFSVILANFAVFSLKYEHISDCQFFNRGPKAGDDNLTFICGESNGESSVFVDTNHFKCADVSSQDRKWPGTIDFKNCRFRKISINFFELFISLHTFIASDIELESMETKNFRDAKNLTHLDVSHNQLTAIQPLLFFNAEKLARADFSRNAINQVDPLAFMGANNLKSLDLSHNNINQVDSKVFSTPKLSELNLSNNNLSIFEEHTFDNITELKHLNLSFNPIGDLKIEIFTYLTNLETLDLKNTGIASIQLGTFSHQQKLTLLDLSENKLQKLDFNHFLPVLPDLRSLNLDGNQLTNLSGFGNVLFPKLEHLDIRDNKFNCVYLENFMKSVNWEKLRLPIGNPTVKAGEKSIRGIRCEAGNQTVEAEATNIPVDGNHCCCETIVHNHKIEPEALVAARLEIESKENKATESTFNVKQTFHNDLYVHLYLGFICIMLTVFIILYVVANFQQLRRLGKSVTFQHEKTDKPSPAQQTVEFTNHSEMLLIKER